MPLYLNTMFKFLFIGMITFMWYRLSLGRQIPVKFLRLLMAELLSGLARSLVGFVTSAVGSNSSRRRSRYDREWSDVSQSGYMGCLLEEMDAFSPFIQVSKH